MMGRSSLSILRGLAKEPPGECAARLLALLRSPFARPRRWRQLAPHRRIPESLSGAPGAGAAAGGLPRRTQTTRCIVERSEGAAGGLAACGPRPAEHTSEL